MVNLRKPLEVQNMIGVIGDLHGCYNTFAELLDRVWEKYNELSIYCVGDLVDRGNYSDKCVQLCIDRGIKVVMGNHDCMFLYSFEFPNHPYREVWVANGNKKTLMAYAKNPGQVQRHIQYINNLPLFYNLEDCFISHAGVSILFEQELRYCDEWDNTEWASFLANRMHQEIGVLWNRTMLKKMTKLQIIGHTCHQSVTFAPRSNGLYIDTGVYMGRALSCSIIERGKHIDTIAVETIPQDIAQFRG